MTTFIGKGYRQARTEDLLVGVEVFGPYVDGDHGTVTGAPDEEGWCTISCDDGRRTVLNAERCIVRTVTAEEGQGPLGVAEGNVTSTPINTCGATRLGAHLYVCLLPIDHNHDHHDPTHNATWSDHSTTVTRRIT